MPSQTDKDYSEVGYVLEETDFKIRKEPSLVFTFPSEIEVTVRGKKFLLQEYNYFPYMMISTAFVLIKLKGY